MVSTTGFLRWVPSSHPERRTGVPPAVRALLHPECASIAWRVVLNALLAALYLRIADRLFRGAISELELTEACGADPSSFHRYCEALVSMGVLHREADGALRLSTVSRLATRLFPLPLRTSLLDTSRRRWNSLWFEFAVSVRTGIAGTTLILGRPLWEYLGENGAACEIFSGRVERYSKRVVSSVLEAYDFSGFSRVVDVAGGRGQFLSALLNRESKATGVLFDLPSAIASAERRLELDPVRCRMELCAGNFFYHVPAGGDVYVLMHVLHNWGNQQAVEILTNCREAMRTGTSLLVIELIVPETKPSCLDCILDLHMLFAFQGRERTAEEFRDLMRKAGFELQCVIPTGTHASIIEATAV